jgi:hypothetical protein
MLSINLSFLVRHIKQGGRSRNGQHHFIIVYNSFGFWNLYRSHIRTFKRGRLKPTIITPYLFLFIPGFASKTAHNPEVS